MSGSVPCVRCLATLDTTELLGRSLNLTDAGRFGVGIGGSSQRGCAYSFARTGIEEKRLRDLWFPCDSPGPRH